MTKKPFEALPVSGATPADLDRDAKAKECDFILVSEIAELKTSKPNKVGGMLKKVSGDANATSEIHDARVEYKLYAVGDQAKPKLSASTKASSGGGFGVGSALKLAAFAGSMYMTMGMGGGMMGRLGLDEHDGARLVDGRARWIRHDESRHERRDVDDVEAPA